MVQLFPEPRQCPYGGCDRTYRSVVHYYYHVHIGCPLLPSDSDEVESPSSRTSRDEDDERTEVMDSMRGNGGDHDGRPHGKPPKQKHPCKSNSLYPVAATSHFQRSREMRHVSNPVVQEGASGDSSHAGPPFTQDRQPVQQAQPSGEPSAPILAPETGFLVCLIQSASRIGRILWGNGFFTLGSSPVSAGSITQDNSDPEIVVDA